MNTNNAVLNVLMYFFERIATNSPLYLTDPALLAELQEHGVASHNLKHLLEIHERHSQPQKLPPIEEYPLDPMSGKTGTRIFSDLECMKLSKKCRNKILELESFDVLNPATREQVIDNLLHGHHGKSLITLSLLKWTVLMILSNQKDPEVRHRINRFLLLEEPLECIH